MIEHEIWQTAENDASNLPISLQQSIQTWIDLNPGWNHNYVDGKGRAEAVKNFDQDLWFIYQQFDKLEPRMKIYQTDLWRYITIYQNGGVYVDTDTICLMPLDSLAITYIGNPDDIIMLPADYINLSYRRIYADYTCSMCQEAYNEIQKDMTDILYCNSAEFAAPKNSKALGAVIDEVKRRFEIVSNFHQNNFDQPEHADQDYNIFPFIVDPAVYSSVLSKLDQTKVIKTFIQSQHINELKTVFRPYKMFSGSLQTYTQRVDN